MADKRDIRIGKKKAKRLGVDPDKSYTRAELTKLEMGSGQYVEQNGKTYSKENLNESGEVKTLDNTKAAAEKAIAENKQAKEAKINRTPIVLNNELINQKEQVVDTGEDKTVLGELGKQIGKTEIGIGPFKTDVQINPMTKLVVAAAALTAIEVAALAGGTAVSKAAIVGRTATSQTGKIIGTSQGVPVYSSYATNAKSLATTTSYLSKLAGAAKNPVFVASTLVGAIGSYPFAGFIKEEALQTLGFAVNTAKQNKDVEGGKLAIEEQLELLDPSLWDQIIGGIPYANVVRKLKNFYKAARTKLKIDARAFAKLEEEIANPPETFEESSKRIADEKREEELKQNEEDSASFQQQREETRQLELEQRASDAEYYRLIREKKYDEAEELLATQLKGGR